MGEEDDRKPALVSPLKRPEDLMPVCQRQLLPLAEAAADLLNGTLSVCAGQLRKQQLLKPRQVVDHDGLILVRLRRHRVELHHEHLVTRRHGKARRSKLLKILATSLNEDRTRSLRRKRGFPDPIEAVTHDSWGHELFTLHDPLKSGSFRWLLQSRQHPKVCHVVSYLKTNSIESESIVCLRYCQTKTTQEKEKS